MKKLLALLLATMMLLSLFACDDTGKETEAPSQSETESDAPSQSETESNVKETEKKTEAPTQKETEAPTQSEASSENETESNKVTETETESEKVTERESESNKVTERESESDKVTERESESDKVTETETESDKVTETESESDKVTETESDKVTETETESEKVTETETEPEPDDGDEEGEIVYDPDYLLSDIDFYFAVEQEELGKTLYLNGKMDGYYPASTSDISEAVRVRLEWHEGRYYVYFIENGTKYYINSTVQGKLVRLTFDTERNTIFSFDRETATLMFAVGDNAYFIGMYDDLAYFSASKADYASESYLARLVVAECSHPYIADADGHTLLKCGRCGTADGEKQAHDTTLSVKYGERCRMFYCATCSYIAKTEVCDGNHYLSDKDGHWEGACEICQTPEGARASHSDVNAEFIVGNTYSYGCSVCAYAYYEKDISGVTQLITPYMWGITATTYYQVNNGKSYGQFFFENGDIPYGRITGGKETVVDGVSTPIIGQLLYNRSYSDTVNTSPNQQYTWDVGDADYLIIKMRTNDNTQKVSFSFSTTGKDGMASGKSLPTSSLKNDEWGVIAIDLKSYFGEYYAKDAKLDSYLVDSFYFTFTPTMASSTYIDVAYMAFLEGGYEEMNVLVDEEEVVLVTASATVNVNIASGSCTGDHAYETQKLDGYYVGKCPACGDTKEYGVSEDALYFASPDYNRIFVGRLAGNSRQDG